MRIILSNTSGVPLYEQIESQIKAAVLSGELAPGEPLMSLRQLARELRVSLITTTRAYNDLAAQGLIANVPGKGSYVLPVDGAAVRAELMNTVRAGLSHAVEAASTAHVEIHELHALLDTLWNEHDHH